VPREKKPDWLKVKLPSGGAYQAVKATVKEHRLSTVCEEAMCPNLAECWNAGTATIMLMGSVCTRACRFCAVDTGNPRGRLDPDEPRLAAESVFLMGLKYVVLTSVDRDDLPDGGAEHYARCVRAIKERNPGTAVEALTPDFQGVHEHVRRCWTRASRSTPRTSRRCAPDAPGARPARGYEQTLSVLAYAKRARPDVLTKTSLMLGLGETDDEIVEALRDLRAIGVDIVTFGQYLRPTAAHLPVERWVTPAEFARYRRHRGSRWGSSRWSRDRWCAAVLPRGAGAREEQRGAYNTASAERASPLGTGAPGGRTKSLEASVRRPPAPPRPDRSAPPVARGGRPRGELDLVRRSRLADQLVGRSIPYQFSTIVSLPSSSL
jgi:lipoyl synthase